MNSRVAISVLLISCLGVAFPSLAAPSPPRVAALNLVELVKLDPTIHLDVRYATENNFMHRVLYPQARVFLERPAAEAVVRVNHHLKESGFGLIVFDGYRPLRITRKMWDETPVNKRQFVADPTQGSRHNRGCAVDLTLLDLGTGESALMPSEYDEFSPRAYANYTGGSAQRRLNRDFLRKAMEAEGFEVYPQEWWHFDYKGWRDFPVMDFELDDIEKLKLSK